MKIICSLVTREFIGHCKVTGNGEEKYPHPYFVIIRDYSCRRVYWSCIARCPGTENDSASEPLTRCSGTHVHTAGITPEWHTVTLRPSRKCVHNDGDYADRLR